MKKKIFIIALLCLILDQLSKFFVTSYLEYGIQNSIIPSFFSLTYIKNFGAAWGIFSNGTIFLAIISIIFLFFAIKYVLGLKNIKYMSAISYGMLFGGVVGNLIDRLFRGHVVDFFSFQFFSYDFPVFNVADCFIVVSILIIVIEMIIEDKKVV